MCCVAMIQIYFNQIIIALDGNSMIKARHNYIIHLNNA